MLRKQARLFCWVMSLVVIWLGASLQGCAPSGPRYIPLLMSHQDSLEIDLAKSRAARLIEYDHYTWYSSDTLSKYVPKGKFPPHANILGLFSRHLGKPTVYFGVLDSMQKFQVKYLVEWEGNVGSLHEVQMEDAVLDQMAQIQMLLKDRAKSYIQNNHAYYNNYVLTEGDHYLAYLIPGFSNRYLVFGGGLRGVFSRQNQEMISFDTLHKGVIVLVSPEQDDAAVYNIRSSSCTRLINEVDYFQIDLGIKYFPTQIIISPLSHTQTIVESKKGQANINYFIQETIPNSFSK